MTPEAPPAPPDNTPTAPPQPEYEREPKKPSRAKKTIIIIAVVLAVLCAAAAGGGILVRSGDTVFPGASVGGVSRAGLNRAAAAEKLEGSSWYEGADDNITVLLPADCSFTINSGRAGAVPEPAQAANAAFRYGRDCNVFSSLYKYLRGLLVTTDLTAEVMDIDEEYIRAAIDKALEQMNEILSGETYCVDLERETLSVLKGGSAVEVKRDDVYNFVIAALADGRRGEIEFEYSAGEAEPLDIAALHELVFAEPKDASYDSETNEVNESVTGVDFDTAEAQRLWDAAEVGDLVEIPITVTEPEYTTERLSEMLFADVLGVQTTYFRSSSANRINNIVLSAEKINGLILNPGDEFSYNGIVGQRTEAAGFKYAGAYANGEVVQEIGGGICQVSSTLYCSALYANLQITNRVCHYFGVDYLPAGLDATVSWKTPDFKFKNNRDFPIKIVAAVDEEAKSVTIEILGTDVDGSYVEMRYSSWKYYDEEYPEVALGYKATTYRNVYDRDGNLISSEKEATSTYHYHEEDIEYPEPSPSPTSSAEPTQTTPPDPWVSDNPEPSAPVTTESPEPSVPAGGIIESDPDSGYLP